MVNVINDSNFGQEISKGDKPVIVDFWAAWCGPCKMLSPVIDEIAGEYGDKAVFYKLNVDENPVTSMKFNVSSIPTVIVFKNGKVAETLVGFRPKQAFKTAIDKYL
ncbi:MAG TPA: thioredoxin [Clostridiaceae bacterium]|jgi:thioredoxin 1